MKILFPLNIARFLDFPWFSLTWMTKHPFVSLWTTGKTFNQQVCKRNYRRSIPLPSTEISWKREVHFTVGTCSIIHICRRDSANENSTYTNCNSYLARERILFVLNCSVVKLIFSNFSLYKLFHYKPHNTESWNIEVSNHSYHFQTRHIRSLNSQEIDNIVVKSQLISKAKIENIYQKKIHSLKISKAFLLSSAAVLYTHSKKVKSKLLYHIINKTTCIAAGSNISDPRP